MGEQWQKAKDIFNEALRLDGPERDEYIRDVCGNDAELRKDVTSLLSSIKGAENFLEDPAVGFLDADTPTIPNIPKLDPGQSVGHYKILDHLGTGGMGEVYLAEDPRLDRTVVLKFLLHAFRTDEIARKRFLREARMASAIDHPNVCTVYEISQYDGVDVIAMQYVRGKTLKDVASGEPVEIQTLLDIAKQLVAGLAAAHEVGIIHRDLKPANILVTPKGVVKILDFGLAKPLTSSPRDTTITQGGTFVGTPAYMSPEQVKGKDLDVRSDIFSLGSILYEMATGTSAFADADKSTIETLHSVVYEDPHPIEAHGDPTLDRLRKMVSRCLEKDPERRYQSLDELSGDLGDSGEILPRIWATRRTGRSRTLWLFVVAAIVVVMVGAYLGIRYYKPQVSMSPATPGAVNSIAVLPFQNQSADPETDYLSDGLAESLIFRLSQLPGLRVSPTSSVMHYKGKKEDPASVAHELGVDAVLTGRLTKRGDNLNISVELVDTRNNTSLWGEQYERRMSDLLVTQRDIAATVVQKLQLKLVRNETGSPKKFTDNNDAYQLYLKARFYFARRSKQDVNKSVDIYQQAIRLDPNFALAYAALAEAYAVMASFAYASPLECMPKAKAANAKALELEPDLPEAHTVAGVIAATYDWDWPLAERELKRALELDPNLAVAHFRYAWNYLSPLGRHDEALAEQRRALELEPLSLIQGSIYASMLVYARRYDEALEQAWKTRDLDPNFANANRWLCRIYSLKGMYAESLAISERTLNTDSPYLEEAAYAYAKTGQRDKALAIVKRYKELEKHQFQGNHWIAIAYTALGDKDAAFATLERAYREHDWLLQHLKSDPFMDPLHGDPRFDAIVKRLNYPN